MACPTWAAWAAWTCKRAVPEAKQKGPAAVHPAGPFSFCITLARERDGGMRILVAEDDAVLADAVQRSLRQSGHAVDWVQNGAQAEDAVQVENFDLLILDLGLPKKSGLDVLKRLRARDSDPVPDPHGVRCRQGPRASARAPGHGRRSDALASRRASSTCSRSCTRGLRPSPAQEARAGLQPREDPDGIIRAFLLHTHLYPGTAK